MKRISELYGFMAFVCLIVVAVLVGLAITNRAPNAGASLPTGAALFETSLQDRITSSDTSMTLVANSVRGSESLSGFQCFTIDEGRSDSEYVCGTVSGTSVTSLTRGISFTTGTTSVAALKFAHRKGANVKVTDYPLIQRMKAILAGEDTVPALMTYDTSVLISVGSPTSTLATKYYVDNVAVAGASNADDSTKGIVETATAAEAAAGTNTGGTGARLVLGANLATSTPTASCSVFCIPVATAGKIPQSFLDLTATWAWTGAHTFSGGITFSATSTAATSTQPTGFKSIFQLVAGMGITATTPQAVTLATSSGRVMLVDADVATTTDFQGFAISSASVPGAPIQVQKDGVVTGFSGLTAGSRYYVQDTAGSIGTSVGTSEVYVGIAISATELLIDKGAGSSWQYLGSQSLTANADTIINQPFARFAIVKLNINSTSPTLVNEIETTIAKVGKTTATLNFSEDTSTAIRQDAVITWTSTSSIRVGCTATNATFNNCTGTIYYYR